jgi:hypothetical protein
MSKLTKAMRVSQSLCIVLLLLSCGALSAKNQEHRVRNMFWLTGPGQMVPAGKAFTTFL